MKSELPVLYGIHPVEEAMAAGRRNIVTLYTTARPSGRIRRIADRAAAGRIPVEVLSADRLKTLAGTPAHQGVCARVSAFAFADTDQLLAADMAAPILVLDGLVDPRNVGALIRTADCVGVSGIVLPKNRSAPVTASVSMVSAGALEHCRVARATNISRTLSRLKDAGRWVVGLDPTASQSIYSADLSGPLALVVGSEEKGIRPLVRKNCDFRVSIPQQGRVDSLNVSVAGAVALYEIWRQRQAAAGTGGF